MPLYEYGCNHCGASFEIITRWSEAQYAPVCPVCSSEDTQKKLSVPASQSGSVSSAGSSSLGSCGSSSNRFS